MLNYITREIFYFSLCKMEINCKSKMSNESKLIEEVESYFKEEEMIMKNGLCQKAERIIIEDDETELQVRVELKENDSKAEDTTVLKGRFVLNDGEATLETDLELKDIENINNEGIVMQEECEQEEEKNPEIEEKIVISREPEIKEEPLFALDGIQGEECFTQTTSEEDQV